MTRQKTISQIWERDKCKTKIMDAFLVECLHCAMQMLGVLTSGSGLQNSRLRDLGLDGVLLQIAAI